MSDIIIAGAGHGGLTAAIHLAAAGHKVTIFEKNKKGECGLDQVDAFDASAMEYAGLEIPERYRAPANVITFVPLEEDAPSVTLPGSKNYENLMADRKDLFEYLASEAEKAGAEFVYGCEIKSPIVLGSRVAGISTSLGSFYGDMVIDACGVNSPVRSNLPDFMHIDKTVKKYEVLHSYRAVFNRDPDGTMPDTHYNIFISDDGTEGLTWLIDDDTEVDALICRFPETDYADVAHSLNRLKVKNSGMGTELIRGGSLKDIPVRQPLAILVADGYAAVGDSAFMTYAIKGSGIAYSLMAGTMLARVINADEIGLYTAETLWEYERSFYKEIGFSACRIAVMKGLLPYLTAQEVSDMFRCGLVSSEELQQIADEGLSGVLKGGLIQFIGDKIKALGEVPELRSKLLDMVGWLRKFTVIEPLLPNKYSREDAEKWAEKYNEVFETIRRKD